MPHCLDMRTVLVFMTLMVVAACGGPRQPILNNSQAAAERRVLDLRIVAVFDALNVPAFTQGSHLIEVKVLGGAPEYDGLIITLPYDEWAVGRPPPTPGTQISIAPRQWLITDPGSKGRPLQGWNGSDNHQRMR